MSSYLHHVSALVITLILSFVFTSSVALAQTNKEELWETCLNVDCIVNRGGQFWLTAPFETTDELLDRYISMAPSHLNEVDLPKHNGGRFTLCDRAGWTSVYRSSGGPNVFELEVLKEVNLYRVENGLSELTICPVLSMSARLSAQVIAETGNYSHYDKYYGNPVRRAEFFDSDIGNVVENIWAVEAINFGGRIVRLKNNSPSLIVEGWKNSPSHNAAMLKPDLVYVGVGHINAVPLAPVVLHMSQARGSGDEGVTACSTCELE